MSMNGSPPPGPGIPMQPIPFAWSIEVGMMGDAKVFAINFDTFQGHTSLFADEPTAEAMRDRWTELLSGLVLPKPTILRPGMN